MKKITPFLMFNDKLEEALDLYSSIFKNSKIENITRYGEEGPGPEGTIMSATFQLEGQEFMAYNGGPTFEFSQGMSLFVNCETQEEVDELWEKLSEDGEKLKCGWVKDKFGISWQVIPTALGELLSDPDPIKAQRVLMAMLEMNKIDIKKLRKAYDNE
jgi:predicted 3-demethylubiquinone-9 3-methyltransferase (glyoxalase superfamily)